MTTVTVLWEDKTHPDGEALVIIGSGQSSLCFECACVHACNLRMCACMRPYVYLYVEAVLWFLAWFDAAACTHFGFSMN